MAKLNPELERLFTECKNAGMHCFYADPSYKSTIDWGYISDGKTVLSVSVHNWDWSITYSYKSTKDWGSGCNVFDSFYDETFKRPYKHIEKNAEWIKKYMCTPNFNIYSQSHGKIKQPNLWADMEDWKKNNYWSKDNRLIEF